MPFITQGKTNIKYIMVIVILAAVVSGGILVYQYWWLPNQDAKEKSNIPGVVKYSECASHYAVSCYQDLEKIKENIPCSSDKDCSFENMKSFCSPGGPNLLLCIGAKYYCGEEGYCKGCDCPATKDETANWKTYKNEGLGFSFKYPQDWIITNDTLPKINAPREAMANQYLEIVNNSALEIPKWRIYVNLIIGVGLPFSPDIEYSTSPTEERGIEVIQRKEEAPAPFLPGSSFTPHQLDGEVTISAGGQWDDNYYDSYFTFKEGGKDYELTFNQILSTFRFTEPEEEFCGWSTNGSCSSDSDCMSGGCSEQVCQPKNEEGVITTCEYKDCYSAEKYGLDCKCVNNKCQWVK